MFRSSSKENCEGKNALKKNACNNQVGEMRLPRIYVTAEINMHTSLFLVCRVHSS